MLRLPFVILMVSGLAFAQPKPGAPAARVPTRPVPCVKDSPKLFASGVDAVVCWDTGCMKLDMSNSDASWIVKPAAAKPWMIRAAEVNDTQVCLGTSCKPLGKKLLQAIADQKKDLEAGTSVSFQATTDLKTVIFGHDNAWSVPNDKKLTFTPPAGYAKTGEKPNIVGHTVVGDLIVVNWSACAGPCTKFSIVNSAGRPKGPTGEGGGDIFQLDAKRFVVMSEYSHAQVFELGTARPHSNFHLQSDPSSSDAIRVDDETIFVMYGKSDGRQVVKVSLPADKKIRARADESMFLPGCHP